MLLTPSLSQKWLVLRPGPGVPKQEGSGARDATSHSKHSKPGPFLSQESCLTMSHTSLWENSNRATELAPDAAAERTGSNGKLC